MGSYSSSSSIGAFGDESRFREGSATKRSAHKSHVSHQSHSYHASPATHAKASAITRRAPIEDEDDDEDDYEPMARPSSLLAPLFLELSERFRL
jgi:hypothetical protein